MTCVSGHCSNARMRHIRSSQRFKRTFSNPPLLPVRVAAVTGKIKRTTEGSWGGGMAMQTALCCRASLGEIKACLHVCQARLARLRPDHANPDPNKHTHTHTGRLPPGPGPHVPRLLLQSAANLGVFQRARERESPLSFMD